MAVLTASQFELYAYICALLGGSREASDVLQEANLTILAKAAEYDPQHHFLPWARAIAFHQVLTHRKRSARNRLLFDDELLHQVSQKVCARSEAMDFQLAALDDCLGKLPSRQQALIQARYYEGIPVRDIASRWHRPANAIAAALYRIRKALFDCLTNARAVEAAE